MDASKRSGMSISHALTLLRAMRRQTMTLEQIMGALEVSRPTVFRLLCEMRQQLGVSIDHDATAGGYRVTQWGLINRRRL